MSYFVMFTLMNMMSVQLAHSIRLNQHEQLVYRKEKSKTRIFFKKFGTNRRVHYFLTSISDQMSAVIHSKYILLRSDTTSGSGWTILTDGAASKVGASKLGLAAAKTRREDKTI